jgi:hypothetical protein
MAGYQERRENGDGTYSVNTALTDSDSIIPVDLRDHGMNPLNPLVVKGYTAQVIAHSGVNLRDIANNDIVIDVSQLSGEKALIVNSTLNQAIDVTLFAEAANYTFAILGSPKNLLAGGIGVYTSSDWSGLKTPIQKLRVRIKAATAPTTGSVTTLIEGVQA